MVRNKRIGISPRPKSRMNERTGKNRSLIIPDGVRTFVRFFLPFIASRLQNSSHLFFQHKDPHGYFDIVLPRIYFDLRNKAANHFTGTRKIDLGGEIFPDINLRYSLFRGANARSFSRSS